MGKTEIHWEKFNKSVKNVGAKDQFILSKLCAMSKKNVRWIDLVPTGLRISYVSC